MAATGSRPQARAPRATRRRTGPAVIGYDGSRAAEEALEHAADVLRVESALVVVVWEAGAAYESAEWAAITLDTPAPTVDLQTAAELDQAAYASAERAAQRASVMARSWGLPADALVVADDRTVADTLIGVARERDASILVIGGKHHGRISEALLGSTEKDVVRRSPCPVLVVREEADREQHDTGSADQQVRDAGRP
jgi:nucleotide-binding universal stress UspA family protein